MPTPRRAAVDLVLLALAVICVAWALYAQTIAIPRNRARANEFLTTPNIDLGEMTRYSSDTLVSVTGMLHRQGAAPEAWIAYIESSRERDTRASAPSEYRWVTRRVERPRELELRTSSGGVRLVPAVEDYPLRAATNSRSGNTQRLGFRDGQQVTVFGRIERYSTDGSPDTFAFDEIWGQDWAQIQQPYVDVANAHTSPGVIVLGLAGLGLAGVYVWRRSASATR